MAIFLLIYIVICLIWFFWAGILTYLLLRYRYPDKLGPIILMIFWGFSIFIFIVSVSFIFSADWVTVPALLQGSGV